MEKLDVKKEEYVGSYICNKTLVNLFIDDYGQQFYFQYVDENGELKEQGCGAYSLTYEDQIKHEVDYEGWFEEQPEWYKERSREAEIRTANGVHDIVMDELTVLLDSDKISQEVVDFLSTRNDLLTQIFVHPEKDTKGYEYALYDVLRQGKKNMLTKAEFVKTIKDLEAINNLDDSINTLYRDAGKELKGLTFDFLNSELNLLEPMVVHQLERMFELNHSDCNDLSYFIYELNFGKEWTPNSIKIDDIVIDISTPEKLYDHMLCDLLGAYQEELLK